MLELNYFDCFVYVVSRENVVFPLLPTFFTNTKDSSKIDRCVSRAGEVALKWDNQVEQWNS